MSKIVQAVNAMLSNSDSIAQVVRGDGEIFFRYKGKYTWSMSKPYPHILYLRFYPDAQAPNQLASHGNNDDFWNSVNIVVYNDKEIGTREAKASFAELFTLLNEQVFEVNSVLDDIIADLDLS